MFLSVSWGGDGNALLALKRQRFFVGGLLDFFCSVPSGLVNQENENLSCLTLPLVGFGHGRADK